MSAAGAPSRRWAAVPWLGAAALLWVTAVAWVGVGRGHVHRGVVELFANEPGVPWGWWGWLHPPLATTWVDALDAAERELGWLHGQGVLATAGLLHVSMLLLGSAWVAERAGPRRAALAALLLLSTASWLRPFEHYPLAGALGLATLLLLGRWAERGGAALAAVTAALGFAASCVHIWVACLLALAVLELAGRHPERRRGLLLLLAAWTLAGLWVAWPEAFRLLARGPGPRGGEGGPSLEWTNPVLLFTAILAARRRDIAPLAASSLALVALVLVAQALQLADGQPWPWSLHYLSLVDPVLALGAALSVRTRWGAALVLASQFVVWGRGAGVAWPETGSLLTLLPPWRWW